MVLLLTILLSSSPRIASLTALNTASFTSWTVPTPGSGPWALTLDHSGTCCWFLEYFANKVGHFDSVSSTFQEWTIPTPASNPYSLAITSIAGTAVLWGTEFGSDKVFAFWPTSGIFREYSLPHVNTGVGYISIEPPGTQVRVWFTETIRNLNGEFLYDPTTQNVTLYEDALPSAAGGGAYGVYAGSSTVWFAGYSALVRWERALQRYTIFPLPVHGSAVGRFIVPDAYGQIWYTQGVGNGESGENFVGVLHGGAVIQEWRLSTIGSDPRGISINPLTQQPWIVEQSPAGNGTIAVLADSSGGTIVPTSSSAIATSGGTPIALAPVTTLAAASTHTVKPTVAPILGSTNGAFSEYSSGLTHQRDIVVDSTGDTWISDPEGNKIARISRLSSDFALTASPPFVSLPQGSSGSVTVTGTSTSGYAGPVTLVTSSVATGVIVSASNPNLLIPSAGKVSSNIVINIAPNATAGISRIIIQGNNGSMNHAISIILTITNSTAGPLGKPQCLIATATYGSELSPEVEVLRNFRDTTLKSKIGSSFLLMFNAWYYSFSPHVAMYLSNDHSVAREMMKVTLYPLIAFLLLASNVYNGFSDHELAIALSGLLASSLIGAFYIGIPLGILTRRPRVRILATCGVIFSGGIVMLLIGIVQNSVTLLMLSSSITVLSTLTASATLTAAVISRRSRILQVIRKPLE
jgi:streptogramin lyase